MIYLDNNATTVTPKEVIAKLVAWTNKGNPSASYKTAVESREMMGAFAKFIAANCNFIPYTPNGPKGENVYQIIWMSGATEANNTIIRSAVSSYKRKHKVVPHIVVSAIEHKSILDLCEQLVDDGEIECTFVAPTKSGHVPPEAFESATLPNTIMYVCMHANNETGAINDIKKISNFARAQDIMFYSDATQTFGKLKIDATLVDAFGVSFHKMHGPLGVGALVVKRSIIEKMELQPVICGSQNCGFRGGTENVPAIAASYLATQMMWNNRLAKNTQLHAIKQHLIDELSARIPTQTYLQFLANPLTTRVQLVMFGDNSPIFLPNTLLISVVKRDKPDFCNVLLRKRLQDENIVVSIGSACNTGSSKASHVLDAMGATPIIKRGTIRISTSDDTTISNINTFVQKFVIILKDMCA